MRVKLEFVHVPAGATIVTGPHEFVQVTYDVVRVGAEGETEIAFRNAEGYWMHGGSPWTDFIVYAADGE